jgi:hypothetical protein
MIVVQTAFFIYSKYLIVNFCWLSHSFNRAVAQKLQSRLHLTGNTSSCSGIRRNQNRFDHQTIMQSPRFHRTIFTALHRIYFDVVDHKITSSIVRVCFETLVISSKLCAFAPQPFIYLIPTKRFVSISNKKVSQLFFDKDRMSFRFPWCKVSKYFEVFVICEFGYL